MSDSLMRTVMADDVIGFAKLSGDNNPVHLSDHFAAQTPFRERIAHGLYTASLISALLGTRLPGPGAIYISQSLNFRAPVRIGDVITARVEVRELDADKRQARLECECIVDAKTVLDGEAIVMVPSRRS
ncbi:MaoC family dehydratase [Microbaculum marinum]|uniref:MaoC family dehydratase n=1 Tax=Microbaculum marinum TaxID=1764581 RepID=A0AAW9RUP5_9HYPH